MNLQLDLRLQNPTQNITPAGNSYTPIPYTAVNNPYTTSTSNIMQFKVGDPGTTYIAFTLVVQSVVVITSGSTAGPTTGYFILS